jgi:hypothetical protein
VLAGLSFLISQKGTMYALAGGVALVGCLVVQRERRGWRDVLVYTAGVLLPIGLYVAAWSLVAPFDRVFGPTFGQQTQLHALTTAVHGGPYFYWFSWLETVFRNPVFYIFALWAFGVLLTLGRAQKPLETLLLFYSGAVALVALSVRQPWPYMFVLIVPTAFVVHAYLFTRELGRTESLLRRPLVWACYVLLGLAWPLWSSVPSVIRDDPGPQRQTVELAVALLQPGDKYFAGFQVLYRGDAHETALGMADTNAAFPIHGLPQAEHAAILERFQKEPVRLLIWTTVIDDGVPDLIKKHLFRTYAPFWGNIWLYALQCHPSQSQVNLLFAGSYLIDAEQPERVQIDGRSYAVGDYVELDQGPHTVATPVRLRLKLRPANVEHLLNPAYREPIAFFWPYMGPAADHVRNGVWVDD